MSKIIANIAGICTIIVTVITLILLNSCNNNYDIECTFEYSDDAMPVIGKYVSLYNEKDLFLDSVKTDSGGKAIFSKLSLKEDNIVIVKIKSLNFIERENIADKKDKQNIVLDKNIIDRKSK